MKEHFVVAFVLQNAYRQIHSWFKLVSCQDHVHERERRGAREVKGLDCYTLQVAAIQYALHAWVRIPSSSLTFCFLF